MEKKFVGDKGHFILHWEVLENESSEWWLFFVKKEIKKKESLNINVLM